MTSGHANGAHKVLLFEINEITWDWIDPLIAEGKLPTFAWLKQKGTIASPMSVDMPPWMDPWVTWTTVYTGREQTEHNLFFLQQPPETIRAKRIWELCNEQGLSVGVYGSLCSWPPQKVNGYYIPDTFAPSTETYPETLEPIQRMNLTYTRSNNLPGDTDSIGFKARLGAKLLSLGVSIETMATIAGQFAGEMRNPRARFRRAALQPLVNFDFFSKLYTQYRPAFATFHTNHVAHYMHNYWKAAQPELFPQETTEEEVKTYGSSIDYGYRIADDLVKRVLGLLDDKTILVIASSLGQQPYISDLQTGNRNRIIRSLDKLAEILGVEGRAKFLATMADQFNVYPDNPEIQDLVVKALDAAYIDTPDKPMFIVTVVENSLTVTLRRHDGISEESRICFPATPQSLSYRYGDLVYEPGGVKSGMHHPKGMMILYGPGIRENCEAEACNNLDIAPTLLTLLGLPVPAGMKGRILHEALVGEPAHSVSQH